MKIASHSAVSKSFAVVAATIAIAALSHAQNAVPPSTVAPAVKTAPAKNYNRALDADLIASVLANDIKQVRKLLGRNADPNAKGVDYATTPALSSAASNGYLEATRALVEAGANLEGGDSFGNVPLMVAALNNRAEVIRYLLQRGASIEGNRNDGLTPLKTAATLGKNDALRALIAAGADVNTQKSGSLSPLMAAALMGNVETVRALIANGANVNARLVSNETALFHGAKYTGAGNLEIVKMLVEAGADVSIKNDSGKYAHEIAVANKMYNLQKYLVGIFNRDADLFNLANKADTERKTATANTRSAHWQLIKDELAKGANPRFANAGGFTTLHNIIGGLSSLIATLDDNDSTMKTLIARSDLNAQIIEDGATVLHFAVDYNNAKLVSWLIKAGANLNVVSTKKETPLDWALADKRQNVIALLQNAGAKTYAQLQNPTATVATPSTPVAPSNPVVTAPPANTIAKSPLDKINMEGYDQGVTVLMQASRDDKVAEVERLLKEGATVDIVGPENGHTALFFAAFGNSSASMKALLKAGANINFLNHNGETPLVAASFRSSAATVRYLVEAGADLKYLDAAMENAKGGNNVAVVEYLTSLKTAGKTPVANTPKPETKAPPSTPAAPKFSSAPYKSTTQDEMLHFALTQIEYKKTVEQKVTDANWSAVRAALAEGATSRYADKNGVTALMLIAVALPGATDEIERQILERADINAQDNKGLTSLHIAAEANNTEMVGWLIKAGAKLNLLNKNGKTPLDLAVEKRNFAIIQLRDAGAKTAKQITIPSTQPTTSSNSRTALIKLLQQKTFDAEGAEALLKSGADLNAFDSGGKTPLMRASESGTVEAIKWLLSKKIVIDAADKNGMTALMYGAGRDNDDTAWNIVAALLDAKADWKMKNKDGKTAYDLALAKSNDWTAMVLDIEAGT